MRNATVANGAFFFAFYSLLFQGAGNFPQGIISTTFRGFFAIKDDSNQKILHVAAELLSTSAKGNDSWW